MFIGHFAVGLGAKRFAPAVSLGTFFLAVQLADLIWPVFVLMGWEYFTIEPGITAVTPLDFSFYPYSHSLLMSLIWALVFAAVYYLARRGRKQTAGILALLVLSHWLLDVASHRPDMPLMPGYDLRIGMGLWYSVTATLLVEGLMFITGIYLYLKTTKARDRTGHYAFWAMIAFLVIINIGNMFGPPPPNTNAVTASVLSMWLMIAWGYWIDRHRDLKIADSGGMS